MKGFAAQSALSLPVRDRLGQSARRARGQGRSGQLSATRAASRRARLQARLQPDRLRGNVAANSRLRPRGNRIESVGLANKPAWSRSVRETPSFVNAWNAALFQRPGPPLRSARLQQHAGGDRSVARFGMVRNGPCAVQALQRPCLGHSVRWRNRSATRSRGPMPRGEFRCRSWRILRGGYQSEATRREPTFDHEGLGLSIAQWIVNALGGSIELIFNPINGRRSP